MCHIHSEDQQITHISHTYVCCSPMSVILWKLPQTPQQQALLHTTRLGHTSIANSSMAVHGHCQTSHKEGNKITQMALLLLTEMYTLV